MIELGLIGYPLGHSLSPAIHRAALRSCRLEGSYSLFPIPPNDKQGLRDLLARVRRAEITGLNVTIPHKQNVMDFLDELTPTAKAIGAVNTIYTRDGKLIGDNTDAPGFLTDLRQTFHFSSIIPPLSALVLGAGGSARAIVYALLSDGWNIMVAARRVEQAQQFAASLSTPPFTNYQSPITVCTFSSLARLTADRQSPISLLVNTTPVGMTPNTDESPWPENVPFPPDAVVYDLVYNPRETRLVRDACSQGRPATTGLGMLIEQAALAFKIWTGHEPSRESMRQVLNY